MSKITSVIDYVLIATGLTISLADIHQILSIILLVFNVCWIIWKVGYRIYMNIKNKKLENIEDDLKTGIDELKELDQTIPYDSKDKDNGK